MNINSYENAVYMKNQLLEIAEHIFYDSFFNYANSKLNEEEAE